MEAKRAQQEANTFPVRKMAENDLSTVLRIETASFPIAPWKYGASFLRGNQGLSYVVEGAEGQVVGYLVLKYSHSTSPVEAVIIKMATDPVHRGRGVGTFMLTWVKRVAARERARRVFLRVRQSNDNARRLYEREGFTELRAVHGYYAGGATPDERTAIEMEFDLVVEQ